MEKTCNILDYDFMYWKRDVDANYQSDTFCFMTSPELWESNHKIPQKEEGVAACGVAVSNSMLNLDSIIFPIYEDGTYGYTEPIQMSVEVRQKLCIFGRDVYEQLKNERTKELLGYFEKEKGELYEK